MTMENFNKNAAGSDDEDDIESLRLAALKSLKPKTTNLVSHKISENKFQHPYKPSFGAAQTTRHHNRGFRNNSGRAGRNGLPSRIRTNTNLISIQTIDHEQLESNQFTNTPSLANTTTPEVPKLILPQDRYHKSVAPTDDYPKELQRSNKFNRYDDDNSDESESDSSESPQKPVKRERKDSLEMLIEELDNEINGIERKDTKTSDPDEICIKNEDPGSPDDKKQSDDVNNSLIVNETTLDLVQNESDVKIEVVVKEVEEKSRSRSPYNSKQRSGSSRSGSGRSRSPKAVKSSRERSRSPRGARSSAGRSRSPKGGRSSMGRSRSPKGRLSSPICRSRSPRPLFESQYRSPRRSPPRKNRYSPNRGYAPLPPLTINTEVLNTITMAPLSPRSAAFVLENRQILARRQKSPIRRSLSRDRSCSLSPKRYRLSPLRRRSPLQRFDSRKCSLSPRNRSFSPRSSPKRRSTSPRTRRSPPRTNKRTINNKRTESPKTSVHKRLGSRPVSRNPSPPFDKSVELKKYKHASRSISLSLSPSPDRSYHKRPLNETTGYIPADSRRNREKSRKDSPGKGAQPRNGSKVEKSDSVLEARKRKFESPIQIEKNGIIKLKTKMDDMLEEIKDETDTPTEEFEEDIDESDIELDDSVLDLNPNLDDLWSDEESDNENEGRFKSKPTSQSNKNMTILPFRKLLDKPNLKQPLLPKDNSDHRIDQRRHTKRPRTSRRSPPRTSEVKSRSAVHRKKEEPKVKIVEQKRVKTPEVEKKKDKIEEEVKKVEIVEKIAPRKVKIQTEVETTKVVEADDEPEIIIENEDEANPKDEDGDLRAELSRRRAERLIKAGSISESLPARLLKNALQEVVPRTSSKHSKTAKGDSSSTDRRVLILKRLASSPVTKLEPANKVSKKEKKLPIHMRLGSSNALDIPLDEIVRSERRPKRARSSRRNKKAGVQV